MKKLSDTTCLRITSLLDEGLSSRQIESRIKVNRCTVDRLWKTLHLTIKKAKGGKKQRLTASDRKRIMNMYRSGDVETAHDISKQLREDTGKDVSHDTINHYLKEAGLKPGCKPKKPRLLPRHKQARREWAYAHKDWSEDDWEYVIWSDETVIECIASHGWK